MRQKRTGTLLAPGFVNSTLCQSFQLHYKVGDQFELDDFVLRQLASENSPHHDGCYPQETHIITRAWIKRVLKDAAEDREQRRHGIKNQRPMKLSEYIQPQIEISDRSLTKRHHPLVHVPRTLNSTRLTDWPQQTTSDLS